MILTEDEINNMPVNLGTLWLIKKSHIEALDKIKELDPYYYISKWEYYEDRADQLAVLADTLAEEIEGLLLSCSDDLEAANYWCDRADRAETKLQKLINELDRIANDYIPDNNTMAPLALEEMREAIGAALDAAKG
jgi:hypothetical protein